MKKKILNFIKDYIFLRKFLNKLRLVFKILNRQKINFKFLNYGQLSEARSIEMKNLLEDQISKFKKTKLLSLFLALIIIFSFFLSFSRASMFSAIMMLVFGL